MTILRRIIKGQGISTPDKEHFHFQLLKMRFSVPASVLIIYGIKSFDIEYTSKLQSILILGIIGAISIGVYVLVTYAMGTMNLVFGEDVFKKIIDKFKKKKEA